MYVVIERNEGHGSRVHGPFKDWHNARTYAEALAYRTNMRCTSICVANLIKPFEFD